MERLKDILVILAMLIGIVTVAFGCYLAWAPLGFIVGGLMLIGMAVTVDEPFQKQKGGENE